MISLPNYTQVANGFIDQGMQELSGNAVKIFLAISRKTIGWHRTSDKISHSQLMRITGIKHNVTLMKAIKEVEKAGYINKELGANGYRYDLNIDCDGNAGVSNSDIVVCEWVSDIDIGEAKRVSKIDTTKERRVKKEEKEMSLFSDDEKLADEKQPKDVAPQYFELARLIYDEHCKLDDKFLAKRSERELVGIINRWGRDIRLLVERDDRDVELVTQVIRWTQEPGNFWNGNILSGAKLRKQFPTLIMQMRNGNGRSRQQKWQDERRKRSEEYYQTNKEAIDRILGGG